MLRILAEIFKLQCIIQELRLLLQHTVIIEQIEYYDAEQQWKNVIKAWPLSDLKKAHELRISYRVGISTLYVAGFLCFSCIATCNMSEYTT